MRCFPRQDPQNNIIPRVLKGIHFLLPIYQPVEYVLEFYRLLEWHFVETQTDNDQRKLRPNENHKQSPAKVFNQK